MCPANKASNRTLHEGLGHEDARRERQVAAWIFIGLVALLIAIHAPGVGHGFIKDDVRWVGDRVASWSEPRSLLFQTQGFYRPLVSLSFAVDRALYGLAPLGYGVTNLILLLLDAAAIAWLARGLGQRAVTAAVASGIWALNFHGINMAVLWISGRTALLAALGAALSAGAFARTRTRTAGLFACAAMLAKEEAVLLPAVLTMWGWWLGVGRAPAPRLAGALRGAAWTWVALAIYLLLRAQTDAATPDTAAWYYRFTFTPSHVLINASEYIDRSMTFAAAVVLAACLCLRRRPAWTARLRTIVALGVTWMSGMYALTLFLPVRSSLYACLPSIGVALIAADVLGQLSLGWPLARLRRAALIAGCALALLLPVYWSRNVRWIELADLARDTVRALQALPPDALARHHIVFLDDRSTRRSWKDAYGDLLPDAVAMALGRPIPVTLDPPASSDPRPDAAQAGGAELEREREQAVVFRLQEGRVRRVR